MCLQGYSKGRILLVLFVGGPCVCPDLWDWLCLCVTPPVLWGLHECLDLGPWICGSLLFLRLLDQATPNSGDGGGKTLSMVPCSGCAPRSRCQAEGCEKRPGEGSKDSSVPMDGPTAMPPTSSWTVWARPELQNGHGLFSAGHWWARSSLVWPLGAVGLKGGSPRRCWCLFGAT